jgi:hypothetical protein
LYVTYASGKKGRASAIILSSPEPVCVVGVHIELELFSTSDTAYSEKIRIEQRRIATKLLDGRGCLHDR